MGDALLTQTEAETLLSMEKNRATDEVYVFPGMGGALRVPLFSPDKREEFVLDITRGRIDARSVIVLLRLDIAGPDHKNPDDTIIPCPHLHVYREGFGTKWAFPIPALFTAPSDLWLTLAHFMTYCKISTAPNIVQGLLPS